MSRLNKSNFLQLIMQGVCIVLSRNKNKRKEPIVLISFYSCAMLIPI